MKRRLILGVLALATLLAASTVYVLVAGVRPLIALRHVMASDAAELTTSDLIDVADRLQGASDALRSPAARMLGLIPVARQNVTALSALADESLPAVAAARRLLELRSELERSGITKGGAIDLDFLVGLEAAVAEEAQALHTLRRTADEGRNGWLLPAVWEGLTDVAERVAPLERSARNAERLLSAAPSLFGGDEPRTYLILLLNNAELRAAGGIVSAIGTLSFDNGLMTVGDFDYYASLAGRGPLRRVVAPSDLSRRFGRYDADTTMWINATTSPDVPEVAEVAHDLYELSTGIDADGVLLIDPRGLGAFLAPAEMVAVPGTGLSISGEGLPDFVYKEAYARFSGQDRRRGVLLGLGPRILARALEGGDDATRLNQVAQTAAEGHLRFVPFRAPERAAIAGIGLDGELSRDARDGVLVTVQNLGADKLDPWIDRTVKLGCEVQTETTASCTVEVRLRNSAPNGLPLYVVQDKPFYALYEGYLEIYVPERADVTRYELDGRSPEVFIETEDGRKSLGAYFRTERGEVTRVIATYDLPITSRLVLTLTPQPLAEDAYAEVSVQVPEGWVIRGPGESRMGAHTYAGPLAIPLTLHANLTEEDGSSGLMRLWRAIRGFW